MAKSRQVVIIRCFPGEEGLEMDGVVPVSMVGLDYPPSRRSAQLPSAWAAQHSHPSASRQPCSRIPVYLHYCIGAGRPLHAWKSEGLAANAQACDKAWFNAHCLPGTFRSPL